MGRTGGCRWLDRKGVDWSIKWKERMAKLSRMCKSTCSFAFLDLPDTVDNRRGRPDEDNERKQPHAMINQLRTLITWESIACLSRSLPLGGSVNQMQVASQWQCNRLASILELLCVERTRLLAACVPVCLDYSSIAQVILSHLIVRVTITLRRLLFTTSPMGIEK